MTYLVALTDEDVISAFERDGAAVVRGAVTPDWIAAMREAFEDAMNDALAASTTRGGFYNGFLRWRSNPVLRDFLLNSASRDIARCFLRAEQVDS